MLLQAEHISLSYGDGDRVAYAVRDISLVIPETGFFGVMGPSGSGKSSLLYLLSGLKRPVAGKVLYKGTDLYALSERERVRLRREKFGFVFQYPYLINYLTVHENLLVAAASADRDAAQKADKLLQQLHIAHLRNSFPTHLSGGERQRLAVARAMMQEPEVIFADEPTAALDHSNGRAVIDLLLAYRDRGAVIVVSHDPLMLQGADRIYYLLDGCLEKVEEGSAAAQPLRTILP
ncbi:ABC-type antimicrobial peptide transport system, ATPase component [Chthonomonas calidirosea]|uniref:ABC-type antimicrobial peptide transport system,ATPase component n=1 Tax=Chthonomonas calidirosea (strain DSM 23976 / ICMP 18418 / T49) TaxID=1303518 RepID=S0EY69_CHTCT|nr:ATP-binding cassette domain-containing protein [Chthonomonas calidirosea]CCW34765.1 ABC-type antimicrobial peptide transport system,ATPase component [Chthonomonas calidirosea T49]CEK12806.1 ABC-type antimicrobial peptide transport system, ATPase component [Chthonomonas calidirosea]CEK12809.1 ABC-type antimicrobial peptide transport system, ATPase component [Chthonomonas calidirosea]CEK13856.1 ABC-type antimicrobial peptide transport system, ATPase component [Chthonomonas calidirosea]